MKAYTGSTDVSPVIIKLKANLQLHVPTALTTVKSIRYTMNGKLCDCGGDGSGNCSGGSGNVSGGNGNCGDGSGNCSGGSGNGSGGNGNFGGSFQNLSGRFGEKQNLVLLTGFENQTVQLIA